MSKGKYINRWKTGRFYSGHTCTEKRQNFALRKMASRVPMESKVYLRENTREKKKPSDTGFSSYHQLIKLFRKVFDCTLENKINKTPLTFCYQQNLLTELMYL
jgi:hypothetical protein